MRNIEQLTQLYGNYLNEIGWDVKGESYSVFGKAGFRRMQFTHRQTGFRAFAANGAVLYAYEFSIPRLAFESDYNGRLVRAEDDLQRAFRRAEELLAEIGAPGSTCDDKVARLDCASHFPGDISMIIENYRHISLAGIRKKPVIRGCSITFEGSCLLIRMYEKGHVPGDPARRVVRSEVQMRQKAKKLQSLFNLDRPVVVSDISVARTYEVVRGLFVERPVLAASELRTIPEKLAYMTYKGISVESYAIIPFWVCSYQGRHRSRIENATRRILATMHGADFRRCFDLGSLAEMPDATC